jgi:hypothetical protein
MSFGLCIAIVMRLGPGFHSPSRIRVVVVARSACTYCSRIILVFLNCCVSVWPEDPTDLQNLCVQMFRANVVETRTCLNYCAFDDWVSGVADLN